MTLPEEGYLLRIFIGESDRHAGMLLYEWIVRTAKEHGLAGATVLRGLEGFGARSRVRTAKILDLSTDLPIVAEGAIECAGVGANGHQLLQAREENARRKARISRPVRHAAKRGESLG